MQALFGDIKVACERICASLKIDYGFNNQKDVSGTESCEIFKEYKSEFRKTTICFE